MQPRVCQEICAWPPARRRKRAGCRYPKAAMAVIDRWKGGIPETVDAASITAAAANSGPKEISDSILGIKNLPESFRKYFELLTAGGIDADNDRTADKNTQCGIAALYIAAKYADGINAAALWRGTTLCWLCGCPIKAKGKSPQCEHILPALRAVMFKGLISSAKSMDKVFSEMSPEDVEAWCDNTANNYMWSHGPCNGSKGGTVLIKLNINPESGDVDPEKLWVVDVMKCLKLAPQYQQDSQG